MTQGKRAARTTVTLIAGTSLVAIVAAGALLIAHLRRDGVDCDTFRLDTAEWRAARVAQTRDVETARRLATSIARCNTFDGMPTQTLRRQLGPATDASARSWSYSLSPEPGSGLAWLDFQLDGEGRVVDASVAPM